MVLEIGSECGEQSFSGLFILRDVIARFDFLHRQMQLGSRNYVVIAEGLTIGENFTLERCIGKILHPASFMAAMVLWVSYVFVLDILMLDNSWSESSQ